MKSWFSCQASSEAVTKRFGAKRQTPWLIASMPVRFATVSNSPVSGARVPIWKAGKSLYMPHRPRSGWLS